MDVGTAEVPSGLSVKVKDLMLKLDWNINDRHRANLRYTKTEQNEPNIAGFSNTALSLSSWWWNQDKQVESLVGQWFADWSSDFSTEVKVSSRDYASRPIPLNGLALPAIGLRFSGALPAGTPSGVSANNRFLNMGTELSRHFNVLETKTADVYAGGTWNLGKHELKFGFDYARNEIYNAFLQNVNGNYTFACEGTAAAPVTYSFGTVTDCNALTPAQRDLAVLENFRAGKPSNYTVQAPQAGRTIGDGVANWRYANTGIFLQDTFKLDPKVSLMVGVRLDQQDVPDKPLYNPAVAAALVAGSATTSAVTARNSGGFGLDNTTTLDGNQLVQPRLGFNWNLGNKDQRMQLRGGLGLFQGAAANVWLSNPFSNTGMAINSLTCTSYTNCSGVTFSPNPATQPAGVGQPPAPNIDIVSAGLTQPSVWKANLAFDTELPALPVVGKLVAGAEWMHTKTKSGIFYQHLNLGAPTRTGSDGRDLFYTPQTYAMGCWSGSTFNTSGACAGGRNRALSNQNFNNVYLARETSQGGGDALTLSISQPATAGFGWGLAYTMTTAKEVSPLTSSTSGSNFGNRSIFNPNEEVLQNSAYLIKDRVSANLTWSKAFVGSYRTNVGVFFEGRRGKPYSWTYINDLNGDGTQGNDLMYIPSAPGSVEVMFRGGAAEEAKFWEIVNANPALAAAKGGVVGRNNSYAPWVNNFDMRISQELPGLRAGHKASFTLDFLNFGNLLNKKWGRIDEVSFPSRRRFVNFNGLDANGRYIYSLGSLDDLSTKQASGESQWAIQATLRYEF